MRGEPVKSGACKCDVPGSAHEVRKLRTCTYCDAPGKELHEHQRLGDVVERLHTRCAVAKYGLEECVRLGFWPKMRLCCLGVEQMKRLSDLVVSMTGRNTRAVALRRVLAKLVDAASDEDVFGPQGPVKINLPDGEAEDEATSFAVEFADGLVCTVEVEEL